jgi:hypothetical protein
MSAFEEFTNGIAEVRTLLSLCQPDNKSDDHGDPDKDIETERQNAVCRASTVLLVSHFESFLKTTAEEYIDAISIGGIVSKSIPVGIRELHTIPRMEDIIRAPDSALRGPLFKKIADYNCLWVDDAKPPPRLLKASLLRRVVTNSDSEVIDKLFSIMGAPSPVCDGDIDVLLEDENAPTPVNIRLMLRDVVKCRNDIAHGDVSRKPTPEDVDRYILKLEVLARRLEAKATSLAGLVHS